MDELRTRKLRQILQDFHTITGQHIAIFDSGFQRIAEYPESRCDFCMLIRSDREGLNRCRQCDLHGMAEAKRKNAVATYVCHAGLIEVCAPIIDEEEILGYIMLGQLLTDEDRKNQWSIIKEKCASLGCPTRELHQAFQKMKQVPSEVLGATSHIMMACVGYIRLEQLMKRQSNARWQEIQQYISSHLIAPFTLKEMSAQLGISVATICKTVKRNTGKTVGQLVAEDRVQRAGQYLTNTDRPVAEIASIVGIDDYNYFTRLFRRKTGLTPTQYRSREKR